MRSDPSHRYPNLHPSPHLSLYFNRCNSNCSSRSHPSRPDQLSSNQLSRVLPNLRSRQTPSRSRRLTWGLNLKMWPRHLPSRTFHPIFHSWLVDSDPPSTQRRAYVFANPPARNRRQPVGTPQYCKVDGCKRWTTERGKELARHRATHFPGRVGIACPSCGVVFSRSGVCGKHLKKCDPQCWGDRKAKKGTQDAWGIRVGQDLIKRSLVDGEYTPQVKYRL